MTRYLDIETWNRRQQFEFFKDYDDPCFNVCVDVEVTPLLDLTRSAKQLSFFISYIYLSIKTANEIEPFRYRLRGERVLIHERIHAGTTLLLPDETFTFVYFDYTEDFAAFHARAQEIVEQAKSGKAQLYEREEQDDLIYHSVLPWMTFTSISHARDSRKQSSVPKISFGKYYRSGNQIRLPVSVEVHHALMDGLHVGRYFERLENYFSDPHTALNL